MMIRFFFCSRSADGISAITIRFLDQNGAWAQWPIITGVLGLLSERRSVDLEKSGGLE